MGPSPGPRTRVRGSGPSFAGGAGPLETSPVRALRAREAPTAVPAPGACALGTRGVCRRVGRREKLRPGGRVRGTSVPWALLLYPRLTPPLFPTVLRSHCKPRTSAVPGGTTPPPLRFVVGPGSGSAGVEGPRGQKGRSSKERTPRTSNRSGASPASRPTAPREDAPRARPPPRRPEPETYLPSLTLLRGHPRPPPLRRADLPPRPARDEARGV